MFTSYTLLCPCSDTFRLTELKAARSKRRMLNRNTRHQCPRCHCGSLHASTSHEWFPILAPITHTVHSHQAHQWCHVQSI